MNARCTGVVLEDNANLRLLLSTKILPKRKFVKVPIGGGYSEYWNIDVA